jgi:hypothetical protein
MLRDDDVTERCPIIRENTVERGFHAAIDTMKIEVKR